MKWTKLAASLLATLVLVIILNTRIDMIPPLGAFLNPVSGFWQSADAPHQPHGFWLNQSQLQDSVYVMFDDRGVPRIFAKNDYDLYFAQGYITAGDRLWQMDIQVRSAAGTLGEVFGAPADSLDQVQRRKGMMYGARNKWEAYQEDEEMLTVLEAYSDGVNAWIDGLPFRNLPVEYKLLGHRPPVWEPINALLMHMNMSQTLSGSSSALSMSNVRAALGDSFADRFLPGYPKNMVPIVPEGTQWPFEPLQPASPAGDFTPSMITQAFYPEPDPAIGSNSWAVHGDRTETGRPLLANDMHLDMSLPSIWYEIQLHGPDTNTYGVSIPGIPIVIVGFNEQIAWGVTNSGANVLDVFEIDFRDDSFKEYRHDGRWKPTEMVIEEIPVAGSRARIDTVYYTHHGPVHHINKDELKGHATRWSAHLPSRDLRAFYEINRASNYDEFVDAIFQFDGPGQNFTYADREGNVALWHNGLFPLRWEGMGDFISDGSDPAYDWNTFVPREHVPHVVNPERGFVSSANQNPADPDYPYYLGRFFSTYERGARMNERLSEDRAFSYRDMMDMQLDNLSLNAREGVPILLSLIREHSDYDALEEQERDLLQKLESWNYEMLADDIEPTLFRNWMNHTESELWNRIYNPADLSPMRRPSTERTIRMLQDENEFAYLMQNYAGNVHKSRSDVVMRGWEKALDDLRERLGESQNWQWRRQLDARIMHLTRVEALSRRPSETNGATEALNSVRGGAGPSWRMVVSLEDEVKAWGVYPGGQSGNPGNLHYDDFIDPWARGGYFPLRLFGSQDEAQNWLTNQDETEEVRP